MHRPGGAPDELHRDALPSPLRPDELVAIQVCRLFYDDQLPKTEIAARLGLSRFRVARLIDTARATGLVRVEYRDQELLDAELSRRLATQFGLRLCQVVRTAPNDEPATVAAAVGSVAAAVVVDLAGPRDVIGIGWGRTMAAVAERLPARSGLDLEVVQLAGGSARVAFGVDPAELAHRFAARLGAALHPLYAPAFVGSHAVRDALLREPELLETVACFDRITLAVLGIGALSGVRQPRVTSALSGIGVLSDEQHGALLAAGAVGDFILHAFDRDGRFIEGDVEDRAVTISTAQLRRVPRVLIVAFGAEKGAALGAALSTGVPTMLVADDLAALGALAATDDAILAGRRPAPRTTARMSSRIRRTRFAAPRT